MELGESLKLAQLKRKINKENIICSGSKNNGFPCTNKANPLYFPCCGKHRDQRPVEEKKETMTIEVIPGAFGDFKVMDERLTEMEKRMMDKMDRSTEEIKKEVQFGVTDVKKTVVAESSRIGYMFNKVVQVVSYIPWVNNFITTQSMSTKNIKRVDWTDGARFDRLNKGVTNSRDNRVKMLELKREVQ